MIQSIWGDIKQTFNQQKNMVPKLILANIIIFVVLNGGTYNFTYLICYATHFDFNQVLHFFSLPIHIDELIWKPWTLFTYGFLHEDFWHIFFNLMILYIFGNILEEYLGSKKTATVFLVAIIVSALFETLAFQILRFSFNTYPEGYTIGASGAIMAIMAAAATLLPDLKLRILIIDIKLKYIFLFYFLIDLFSLTNNANWGGHIAHLGGAIFGYWYIRDIYKKSYVDRFVAALGKLFQPKAKMKVTHRKEPSKPSPTVAPKTRYQRPNQQEIDSILDKISQSGYDSLTKNEKELLFSAGNDD